MIQIIGLLLCVYLVFKGIEILMTAAASTHESRNTLVVWGVLCFLAAVAIAGLFAFLLLMSGSPMPNLPAR